MSADYKRKWYLQNKERILEKRKEYYQENKEKIKQDVKKYNESNRESKLEYSRQYYIDNKDSFRMNSKKYWENNPGKRSLDSSKRRAAVKRATPNWLTEEDLDRIRTIYLCSKDLRWEDEMHVDHIIPLKGKNVCGLHLPWNLQIITATDNLKKGNKV
jgi:5-methylcytosine-specific restriction endonuclease McrA